LTQKKSETKEIAPWQPGRVLTEADAQKLTIYLVAKAEREIAEERKNHGAEYPKVGTPAYEACVAELAYRLAENWIGAGSASKFQLVDWIEREGLYFHHPRQWESLEQMLLDIADSVTSASGQSVYTRLAKDILPFVREHGIADAVDLMAIIMEPEGGKSKLYHSLPWLTEAVRRGKKRVVKAIINDVRDRSKTRKDLIDKWGSKVPIPPAPAELRLNGSGQWVLTIHMSEEQKRLILSRLRDRVAYNESPFNPEETLQRLYGEENV
jgi:hypothetical protein